MVLVVLTCLLTLVSTLALWLRALVLNTDSYVRAIGPVLDEPAVRDALAETIVAELYSHVDVGAQLRKALPASASEFAPTLAASIHSTSVEVAAAALATTAVRQAWLQANRVAHDQVVHVLEGKDGIVTTARGEVAIDTAGLAALVRGALDRNGIHLFDTVPLARSIESSSCFARPICCTRSRRRVSSTTPRPGCPSSPCCSGRARSCRRRAGGGPR